jgi:CubicO group peptidase (beta-lactamase class C family)
MSEARRIAERWAEAAGIAGWCVALARPDASALIWGGEDWPGSGRSVGPETRFQAASSGKHLTACTVLDLARQGRLDIDQPIGAYLADLPAAWRDRPIRTLMTHTSGLPEYLAYVDGEDVPTGRADFMARYASLGTISGIGETWGYSNTNYILLGFLIAEVAGRPYATVVEDLLSREGAPGGRVASPAWVRAANAEALPADALDLDSVTREVTGDGDIAFTPQGGLQWLQALLRRPVDDPLFQPALLASGLQAPYACGWFVEPLAGGVIAHHAGHYDGWTAMAFLNLSTRAGALALCNLAPGTTRAIRGMAQATLEAFAPGATPLALAAREDHEPRLTASAKRQFIRAEGDVDRDAFAHELQIAIDHGGPVRGVMNLWSGVEPAAFQLVEDTLSPTGRMRRYRITYEDRNEHFLVGLDAVERIYWGWPL